MCTDVFALLSIYFSTPLQNSIAAQYDALLNEFWSLFRYVQRIQKIGSRLPLRKFEHFYMLRYYYDHFLFASSWG
jgi:hypothetical protein